MSISDLPQGTLSKSLECPTLKCSSFTVSELSENEFRCPSCGTGLVLKVVDDVVIPMHSISEGSGYVDIVEMPEIPRERRERFISEHNLGDETADKLVTTQSVADFYEDVARHTDSETAATFVVDTLLGELHYRDMHIDSVDPSDTYQLVDAISEETITWRVATDIIREALDEEKSIDEVFSESDAEKTDKNQLRQIAESIVDEEEDAVQDYKNGQDEAINHLIGRIMQETNGQADAQEARELLISIID